MHDYRFEQATRCYEQGQFLQAISLLKELLGDDPNNADYHGLLAAILLSQKRIHAAEHEIKIALQQDSQDPYLLFINANIAMLNKQMNKALEICDEALRIDPNFVDALLLKGAIFGFNKQRPQQLDHIEQALSLDPDSAQTLTALGSYYHEIGDQGKAEQVARSALSVEPQNIDANVLMGNILLVQGDIENATYHARFSITQNPESTEALRLFSDIKARQNWFIGAWWRFNSKLSKLGNLQLGLVLIVGYLTFNLLSQVLEDLGYPVASSVVSIAWLALVAYSWIALPIYYKQLNKELEKFQFRSDY